MERDPKYQQSKDKFFGGVEGAKAAGSKSSST